MSHNYVECRFRLSVVAFLNATKCNDKWKKIKIKKMHEKEEEGKREHHDDRRLVGIDGAGCAANKNWNQLSKVGVWMYRGERNLKSIIKPDK